MASEHLHSVTALMRAHDFTQDDLVQNRDGRLSARQRRLLSLRVLRRMALGVVFIGLAVLLRQLPDSLPGYVIAGLFALGLWVVAAQLIVSMQAARPVTALVGPLIIEAGRVAHPVYYRIEGRSLTLTGRMRRRESYRSIVPGQIYRVYLLPWVDLLISLEPIEPDEKRTLCVNAAAVERPATE